MITLDDINRQLHNILEIVDTKINNVTIAPNQLVVPGGLSDISKNLGTIQAGEFRTGNGKLPGDGFSGVRIGYPSFTYISQEWNIVGVANDVFQVGINAADGKLYAGAGSVQIFSGGITIANDTVGLSFGVSDPLRSAYLKTDTDDNFFVAALENRRAPRTTA